MTSILLRIGRGRVNREKRERMQREEGEKRREEGEKAETENEQNGLSVLCSVYCLIHGTAYI